MPWPSENVAGPRRQQLLPQEQQHHGEEPRVSSLPSARSPRGWDSCQSISEWPVWVDSRTIIPTAILTSSILTAIYVCRLLRRFPNATSIPPSYFRRRSLLGKVTSVGDGDNFRMYHTPGGRLAGWGWLPWKKIPATKGKLKDNTIHVRLAGVDAPELPHFGRPEQPFAREAHNWLTAYLINRRVRVFVYRQDQYQRVVGSVYVRRLLDFPLPFRRRDVSHEMLRRGLATMYEAKTGAEFGDEATEQRYRKAEWWAKMRGLGLWRGFRMNREEWESPREYKTRMGLAEQTHQYQHQHDKRK